MTGTEIMTAALRRAGLTISATTFKDNARTYMNLQMADIGALTGWQWNIKEGSLTTSNGTKTGDLGTDVYNLISTRNVTDDFPMSIATVQWLDRVDPDQDETGSPSVVIPIGIDTSSGAWEVLYHPTPDGTYTLKYRYNAIIPEFTSGGASSTIADATDLKGYLPIWVQNALIFGISSSYHGEQNDYQGEAAERALRDDAIETGLLLESKAHGNMKIRLGRGRRSREPFDFYVQSGSIE